LQFLQGTVQTHKIKVWFADGVQSDGQETLSCQCGLWSEQLWRRSWC